MASTLQGVLANIPGLAGYLAGAQNDQAMQAGNLQQASVLQGIAAQQMAAQQRQMALQKEQEFRAALSQAKTPEEQAAVAARYGSPDAVMRVTQGSLDRKNALEVAQQNRQADRERRLEELQIRGEQEIAKVREAAAERRITQAEAAQREAAMRETMVRLTASLRQAPQPQMVQNDQGVFQVGRDGKAVQVTSTDGTPLTGKPNAPEKALPASAAKGLLENQQNLRRAEQALALLEGKKVGEMQGDAAATGNKGLLTNLGVLGDKVLNAVDPSGVDTRAAIGDLGSLVIHDRSGAAVTASEFPRLRPFIPLASDSPDVAQKKVRRFVQVYKELVDDSRDFYKASGFKVPESTVPSAGGPAAPAGGTPIDDLIKKYANPGK